MAAAWRWSPWVANARSTTGTPATPRVSLVAGRGHLALADTQVRWPATSPAAGVLLEDASLLVFEGAARCLRVCVVDLSR
jgi:hypothetical protein